jgi:hypothetical protein
MAIFPLLPCDKPDNDARNVAHDHLDIGPVKDRHVRAGPAVFADDTLLKMQAPGNGPAKTARIWTYVRDERPWLGQSPPAAWVSVDR